MSARNDARIPDLVSVREAALILGISRQAVLKMIDGGRLPGRKVGTAGWVMRRSTVERMRGGEVDA